jgi:hypothetical protein
MLDEVCDRIRELKAGGKTRPDASLGIIKKQEVANRLKEAGLECYGHNLESSRRFFPQTCTTHTFDDRLETIGYLKKAGIKICSGGIIGMGETRADRCDLAFELKAIGANVVPVNILNPIPGTPFAKNEPLPVMEILKTIACFRFILPRQEIMIAGGRTVNLRDAQSMIFMAGASALMVGNYLTTLNQPVEKDLQMLKDLGLDPNWDSHDFSDQEEETVEFVFRFAFGRLDHERAGDGPRKRRRVKAVIHQPFRDIFGGRFVERAQIQNALVRDEAVAAVKRREIFFQSRGDVIRVEDGELRRVGQSVRPHHRDIHPRNVQMLALPHGAALTAPMGFSPPRLMTLWPGRNSTRCSATPIGPTPGPPPPCGMQNVLCRFKWQTSAPMNPGEVKPTCAFMFAPSM